jgi:hypothetical protein
MDRSVQLTYRYHDVHVVELRVSAWNGSFGGSTCLYVGQGDLAAAATLLAGFPESIKDRREVIFGAFGPKSAGGGMILTFACADGAGHCKLRVRIQADANYDRPELVVEQVEMLCSFEPAALDLFVKQMHELDTSLTGSAMLTLL